MLGQTSRKRWIASATITPRSSSREYEFTVDDPDLWEAPWTARVPLRKTEGPVFEYACHEGNYGLVNILSAARAEEQAAAAASESR